MSADALPALETATESTTAQAPPATTLSLDSTTSSTGDRSANVVAATVEERDLQNFAGNHGQVTGVVVESAPGLPGELPDSVSSTEVLAYLRSILHRVREVEAAIDSLVSVDPFQDGEAEALRQEIHQRLLRAAQPYRRFVPTRRRG
jgi:hypothetical protein